MPFCSECAEKLKKDSKYCPNCGEEVSKRSVEIENKPEKVIVHEHKSGSGLGTLLFILIIVGIIIGVFYAINQGVFSPGGTVSKVIDPCERELDSCNRGCGEGWFNGLCKSKCTSDYKECKGG